MLASTDAAANGKSCPVCGSPCFVEALLGDDRYAFPGSYPMVICSACKHRHLNVSMTSEQIGQLYTNFYPRSELDVETWQAPSQHAPLVTWWQGLRSSAFRWVPRQARVLDIGCGFGESLGYHRGRGCVATGVEADANAARAAKRHGLDIRIGLFDACDFQPESFDVVTLDQVVEHVQDAEALLRGIHTVLKPGGLAILSTPNAAGWGARLFGRRWIHWHAPYHLQFFSPQSLRRLAASAGFTVERAESITNSRWLAFQWCHLVAYPPKGTRSVFWNATLPRSNAQRLAFVLLAVVDRLGVNALATRIADFAGQGDNQVFVLRKTAA